VSGPNEYACSVPGKLCCDYDILWPDIIKHLPAEPSLVQCGVDWVPAQISGKGKEKSDRRQGARILKAILHRQHPHIILLEAARIGSIDHVDPVDDHVAQACR